MPNVANNLSRFQRWAKRLLGLETVPRRTEIIIETERVLTIRRRRSTRDWCVECGADADMVDLAEAEALTGMTKPMVHNLAAAKGWHLAEGQGGETRVCLESLLKSM